MKRIIPIILVMAVLFSFFAIVTSADVAYNNISTSYSVDGTYSYRTPYTEEGIYRLGYNYVLLGPHSVEPSNGTYIYTEPFGVTIDGVYCDVVITYLQNGLVSIGFMSNGNTLYNLTYLEDGGISDTTLVGKTVTFDDVTMSQATYNFYNKLFGFNYHPTFIESITIGLRTLIDNVSIFLASLLGNVPFIPTMTVLLPLVGLGVAFTVVKFGIHIVRSFAFGF